MIEPNPLAWRYHAVKRLVVKSTWHSNASGPNSLAVLLGAVIVAGALLLSASASYATKVNYLPHLTLTNQNSQPTSLSSLRGQPVLVGFIHTMCKGVCQVMTANMRSVASAVRSTHGGGVTMLLITTDPADDQPAQLMRYAKDQDLVGRQWILVTGPKHSIYQVMRLYGVKHEDTDDAMMHVMKLFLLAPDGTLARIYPGMKVSAQSVASDIEGLSHRGSEGISERLGAASQVFAAQSN
jgi:cytochrome oxidase Cu insertion factor (SCO1/SenC/PrrC family)